MELPQTHLFGIEGNKSTHDFLSLHSRSTSQPEPRPSSEGAYLKTHDFLQPLERREKARTNEHKHDVASTADKPPPPALPSSIEYFLPGGIATYNMGHIPSFNQRFPRPERSFAVFHSGSTERNHESSNCGSFPPGSRFSLWEESAVKKGQTRKENVREESSNVRETPAKLGQWTSSLERPSHLSPSSHRINSGTLSSSRPTGQNLHSFMEMLRSEKVSSQEEEPDEDEDLMIKKENTCPDNGELRVKIGGKNPDQKVTTPRSKHSATEQRRRSKINDRFQKLRELIPRSDQKRDKASFLLEVIDYVQFLQEKVQKFEGSCQKWSNESPWRKSQWSAESYADQSRGVESASGPTLIFDSPVSPKAPGASQNPVDSDMSSATTFKEVDHHPRTTNKGMPFPPPNILAPANSCAVPQTRSRLGSDADLISLEPHAPLSETRCPATGVAVVSEKQKDGDLSVKGGTINISSAYSQRLLSTLTQALRSSGVDLSQASISVNIELGNQKTCRMKTPASIFKDADNFSSNVGKPHPRIYAAGDSEQVLKKMKTCKH